MIWLHLGLLAGLLLVLVKSSDFFVDAVARIAKYLGVSEFVIGLTVIAIGTSLPELGTEVMAAFAGETELAVGDIIGSCMANIGLILGLGAVFVSLRTFAVDGAVTFFEGLILLSLAPLYIAYLLKFRPRFRQNLYKLDEYLALSRNLNKLIHLGAPAKKLAKDLKKEVYEDFVGKGFDLEGYRNVRSRISMFKLSITRDVFIAIAAGVMIYVSARYIVPLAVEIATYLGVSNNVIGASLIAIGTSFPELAVSIVSLRKGFGNMFLGNMIGSNIFNLTLVTGSAALITPLTMLPENTSFAIPFLVILTSLLFIFVRTRWKIRKFEGAILLAAYLIFLYLLIFGGGSLFIL